MQGVRWSQHNMNPVINVMLQDLNRPMGAVTVQQHDNQVLLASSEEGSVLPQLLPRVIVSVAGLGLQPAEEDLWG